MSCVVDEMSYVDSITGAVKEYTSRDIPFVISSSRVKGNQDNFCLQVKKKPV